jgi:hypothetical protein
MRLDRSKRSDRDMGPAQLVEVEQHALRILKLQGPIVELFDPECSSDVFRDGVGASRRRISLSFEKRNIRQSATDIRPRRSDPLIRSDGRQLQNRCLDYLLLGNRVRQKQVGIFQLLRRKVCNACAVGT